MACSKWQAWRLAIEATPSFHHHMLAPPPSPSSHFFSFHSALVLRYTCHSHSLWLCMYTTCMLCLLSFLSLYCSQQYSLSRSLLSFSYAYMHMHIAAAVFLSSSFSPSSSSASPVACISQQRCCDDVVVVVICFLRSLSTATAIIIAIHC